MTLSYTLRLLPVLLAFFFVVHAAAGLAVCAFTSTAARMAARMRPARAARFLLTLRFLPLELGLFVAGVCIPSYLQFEPELAAEAVGPVCLAAAALGLFVWILSIVRTGSALSRTANPRNANALRVEEGLPPVFVVEAPSPVFALCGVLRPRVLVSRHVLEALRSDEFAAAFLHERAHCDSRDNLKRLCLLIAPGIAPFYRGFDALERHWMRFAEFAADDRAAAGDALYSLSLAAALVRVARMGPAPLAGVETSLVAAPFDLEARVERLLRGPDVLPESSSGRAIAWGAAIAGTCLLTWMLQPGSLRAVHAVIEHLMR